VSDMALEEGNK